MTDTSKPPSYLLTSSSQDEVGDPGERRFMIFETGRTETGLRDYQKDLIEQISHTFCVPADLLKKD